MFWKYCFVITGICQKISICYCQIIHFKDKSNFPSIIFWKIFSFKMFPKHFHVEGTLSEYSQKIACRLPTGKVCFGGVQMFKNRRFVILFDVLSSILFIISDKFISSIKKLYLAPNDLKQKLHDNLGLFLVLGWLWNSAYARISL